MNKQILLPILIIIVGLGLGGFLLLGTNNNETSNADLRTTSNEQNALVTETLASENLRKVDLEIEGMFCLGCRGSVISSVTAQSGVVEADADPSTDSGWVIYDSSQITKEQIIATPIFSVYPAKILDDKSFKEDLSQKAIKEIPSEITQKLNQLAQKLQEREVTLEPFLQEELDEAINDGYFDKANNLLDNLLKAYEEN